MVVVIIITGLYAPLLLPAFAFMLMQPHIHKDRPQPKVVGEATSASNDEGDPEAASRGEQSRDAGPGHGGEGAQGGGDAHDGGALAGADDGGDEGGAGRLVHHVEAGADEQQQDDEPERRGGR